MLIIHDSLQADPFHLGKFLTLVNHDYLTDISPTILVSQNAFQHILHTHCQCRELHHPLHVKMIVTVKNIILQLSRYHIKHLLHTQLLLLECHLPYLCKRTRLHVQHTHTHEKAN